MALRASVLLAVVVCGCHSAGPYGYSPNYVATNDETAAAKGAGDWDPVMFGREPQRWRDSPASIFGVVTSRAPGPGGAAYLTLSVRRLEPRNLCETHNDDDTCRVTVSDKDFGVVHALASLKPDDDVGEHSVGPGSMVRVIGPFGQDVDPSDAAPVMRATFYRHWPRNFYVTKASADTMRQ